jgi:anti-anti-sigma factor
MARYFDTATEATTIMPPGNLRELVRGKEYVLVEIMEPVVRKRSVTLDLRQVERIDAAGIAALISLYGSAHVAGHEFTIVNASHRVAEILALVGLDRILLSHEAMPCPETDPCCEMPAA